MEEAFCLGIFYTFNPFDTSSVSQLPLSGGIEVWYLQNNTSIIFNMTVWRD